MGYAHNISQYNCHKTIALNRDGLSPFFNQSFLFYVHTISHYYESQCSFPVRCHPWCHLPTTRKQICHPSPFSFPQPSSNFVDRSHSPSKITSKLVSSFHSCKRKVIESSLSRPPRPGSPSAGRRATWLPCEQPSAPSAGRPPSTPRQGRLLLDHVHQFNYCRTLNILCLIIFHNYWWGNQHRLESSYMCLKFGNKKCL